MDNLKELLGPQVKGKLARRLEKIILDAKRTDPETGSFTDWLIGCLIDGGVTIRKGFRSDRVMPTQADADKHGYVLAKTETGLFQTVRYEKVGEFPWYYSRWWPLPRVKEDNNE